MLGGLLVSVVIGRFGFAAVAALFLFAILAIPLIGVPGLTFWALVPAVTVAGLCTVGAQFGNGAVSGLLYPTPIRSRGVGWALGVGRFGSIAGPLVGGVLLGRHVPLQQLFFVAAAPMIAGLTASAIASRLSYRRLGALHLDTVANAR